MTAHHLRDGRDEEFDLILISYLGRLLAQTGVWQPEDKALGQGLEEHLGEPGSRSVNEESAPEIMLSALKLRS